MFILIGSPRAFTTKIYAIEEAISASIFVVRFNSVGAAFRAFGILGIHAETLA